MLGSLIAIIVGIFLMWSGYKDLMRQKGKLPRWPDDIEDHIDWTAINDAKLQSYLPDEKNKASRRYRILTFADTQTSDAIIEFIVANPARVEKIKREQL